MKVPVFLCCLLLTIFQGLFLNLSSAPAQGVTFSGRVTNEQAEPVANAYVVLNQGQYYDVTDHKGNFSIANISPGNYALTIQNVGYFSIQKEITIRKDKTGFTVALQPKTYTMQQMVVTATRTRKASRDVAVPVTIVDNREIENTGSTRLSDILAEQTGLKLIANHGTGLQMQGLSADYSLIMINGQPIIGRTAGTLNLNRVSIGNVEKIEIIKGPSSSLWGSDALAGVVNIITRQNMEPFALEVSSRYGTHQTLNLGMNVSWAVDDWQNTVFVDRYSSGGYRLAPNSISQTVPEFKNYTISYRTGLSITDNIEAGFYGRYYKDDQNIAGFLGSRDNPDLLDIDESLQNYSLNPDLRFDITNRLTFTLEHFISGYKTERFLKYQEDGSLYNESIFDQTYNKTEAQGLYVFNEHHTSTLGGGVSWESLEASRYASHPSQNNIFIYAQHDWNITPKLNVVGGFRYDDHSEYDGQFSPKLAMQYEVTDWLSVQASAGRGFKAPVFRQLYLNFTNATVGYSVFGSSAVVERVNELQAAGKIDRILIPPEQLETITAEHSWAYNAGVEFLPAADLQFSVNVFRNNLSNLIETAPIAIKQNGQSIFTYFNLHNVYTQGLDAQLSWNLLQNLHFSLGYQFLDAERKIEEQRTVQDEEGNPVQKKFTFYKPLFNRSRHSGTLKIFYHYEPMGLEANIRGTYRGRYGFVDVNGNSYVNDGEYADGYAIWDAAVAKTFHDRYTLRAGIDNIFDFTRPQAIPYLSGRLFYLQVSLKLY